MAIKKSELYSSLWQSCDELRGGMDASQYKDYVLVMLFIKYISDKYADVPFAPITVPKGSSFNDMVALKGSPNIGDDINKKIIAPLSAVNKLTGMADFNDANKLGDGKEKVERLSNLIAIFENKALDFSKNSADGDDMLGDAYEYLMRHFATESGKSKGQFYTPAEVSRVMAQLIGIAEDNTTAKTTVYDPTCGSGSLLLKIAEKARYKVTLYGQEKDAGTSGIARTNMILHNYPFAEIKQGNTLANPLFLDEQGSLKTFDYVVANPPFSDKRWATGVDTLHDPHNRFDGYGVPPDKNGDYAYLLHIVRSLKSNGKGACILPHGVLFRGNAEAVIREALIRKGIIKGIIGLPANLFYGTGIPACIIVIDKEKARNRKAIFMIDASKSFIKDGNKNRLRDMDIHKIVDVFTKQTEIPKYSRRVPFDEIEKNEFNLNIPRYIDSSEPEDLQNIEAHLLGGIPKEDVDALQAYWDVFPNLKTSLFVVSERSADFYALKIKKDDIKSTIYQHPEFVQFIEQMNSLFQQWQASTTSLLKDLQKEHHPKQVIHSIGESLLTSYTDKALLNKYDAYQHLMNYWFAVMQDDCYLIASDGWKADTYRVLVRNKATKKESDKGWTCDLVPKELVINRYFVEEKNAIQTLELTSENLSNQITELEEEHGGEEGYFSELDRVNKVNVAARLKEIRDDALAKDERAVLRQYLELTDKFAITNKKTREAQIKLDEIALAFYPTLTTGQIKTLVADDKWMRAIDKDIHTQMDKISQKLTQRIKELAERYETPLPLINTEVMNLEKAVQKHLEKMGFVWN